MAEEENIKAEELSFQRTALSYENTLMSWVRTAISMISFGFTIYKFFQEVQQEAQKQVTILTPRVVGMMMISLGFFSLLVAQVQHFQSYKKLRKIYPQLQWSLSSVLSILILIFGVILFLAAFFRQ